MPSLEARTGIKSNDIDDFLAKVDGVTKAIQDMKAGKVDPADVRVEGIETEEEKAAREEALRVRRERLKVEEVDRQARQKEEERERWWRGAELTFGPRVAADGGDGSDSGCGGGDGGGDMQTNRSGESFFTGEQKQRLLDRYSSEYSRWGGAWSPDDPVSREDAERVAAEEEARRMSEFEQNNPAFCREFVEDSSRRREAREKRVASGDALRRRGNRLFQGRCYAEALKLYVDSLREAPHSIATLSNMAQVHLKLGSNEDAIEFCDRALHIDKSCVKALSRRATARCALGLRKEALADLAAAAGADPENADVCKQHDALQADVQEEEFEAAVLRDAAAATTASETGPSAVRASSSTVELQTLVLEPPPLPHVSSSSGSSSECPGNGSAEHSANVALPLPPPLLPVPSATTQASGGAIPRLLPTVGSNSPISDFDLVQRLLDEALGPFLGLEGTPAAGGERGVGVGSVGGSDGRGGGGGGSGSGSVTAAAALAALATVLEGSRPARVLLRTSGGLERMLDALTDQCSLSSSVSSSSSKPGGDLAAAEAVAEPAISPASGSAVALAGVTAPALKESKRTTALLLLAVAAAVDGEARSQLLACRCGALEAAAAALLTGNAAAAPQVAAAKAASTPAAAVATAAFDVAGAAASLLRVLARHEKLRIRIAASIPLVSGLLTLAGGADAASAAVSASAGLLRDLLLGAAATTRKTLASLAMSGGNGGSGNGTSLKPAATLARALRRRSTGDAKWGAAAAAKATAAVPLSPEAGEALCGALANLALHEDFRPWFAASSGGGSRNGGKGEETIPVAVLLTVVTTTGRGGSKSTFTAEERSLALAALINSCAGGDDDVRAAVYDLNGVGAALAGLQTHDGRVQESSGVLRARYAGLLGRLAAHGPALADLSSPHRFKDIADAFVAAGAARPDLLAPPPPPSSSKHADLGPAAIAAKVKTGTVAAAGSLVGAEEKALGAVVAKEDKDWSDEMECLVRVLASVVRAPHFQERREPLLQVIKEAGIVSALVSALPWPQVDPVSGTITAETVALTPRHAPFQNRPTVAGNICACLLHLIEAPPGPLAAKLIAPPPPPPTLTAAAGGEKLPGGVERLLNLFATAGDGPVRRNAAICLAKLARDDGYRSQIDALRGMEMLRHASASLLG